MHKSVLQSIRSFIVSQGGSFSAAELLEEELDLPQTNGPRAKPLEPVNQCYRVEGKETSQFKFFADSKQKTIEIGSVSVQKGGASILVPVHFMAVAAVILKREGRRLFLWDKPIVRTGILVDKQMLPRRSFQEGIDIYDTGVGGGDYYKLKKEAMNESLRQKIKIVDELIEKWSTQNQNELLLIDGVLTHHKENNCIGISRTLHFRYFGSGQHNRIMQMREKERSWAFRFFSPGGESERPGIHRRDCVSWYLRLREMSNQPLDAGLIRVEIAPDHTENITEYADEISQMILLEKLPVFRSFKEQHNRLFPLQICENFLASIIPSRQTIVDFLS